MWYSAPAVPSAALEGGSRRSRRALGPWRHPGASAILLALEHSALLFEKKTTSILFDFRAFCYNS